MLEEAAMPARGFMGVVLLVVLGSGSCTPYLTQWQVQVLEEWMKNVTISQRPPGWGAPWDCLNMTGVKCDPRGQIISLSTLLLYTSEQLAPIILPALSKLSSLTYLEWSDQYDTIFSIPGTIGNLINLRYLKMSHNNILDGSIPASLDKLSALTLLDLQDNSISGSIPGTLGNLRHVAKMYLSSNNIQGSLPASLGRLSSLRSLGLANHRISGSIPGTLGNLTGVEDISLRDNKIEGSLPETLTRMCSLFSLDLGYNAITGSIPGTLLNLTSVNDISLRNNKIEGSIPATLSRMPYLTLLDLGYNEISGTIPCTLGNLTGAMSISLKNNKIEGSLPATLSRMSFLSRLDLSSNRINGSIPTTLVSLPNLCFVNLSFNHIQDSLPSNLGRLSRLGDLILSNNKISGPLPASLGMLSSLSLLQLSFNQLSGSLPVSLGGLSSLRSLQLSFNQLSGSLPHSLGRLLNLTSLNLTHNSITGGFPSSLGNLTGLLELDLSNNALTGELTNVKLPVNLQVLNISGNSMTGDLPNISGLMDLSVLGLLGNKLRNFTDALGMLKSRVKLAKLSLSSSQDGDIIPDFISLFNSLSYLRLQADRFSGELPQQWSPLTQLKTLIIQGEGLSGSLPESLAILHNLKQLQVPDTVMCPKRPCKEPSVVRGRQVCSRCAAFCATCPLTSTVLNNVSAVQALLQFQNQPRSCFKRLWTEAAMEGVEIRGKEVVGILRSDCEPVCDLDFTPLRMFTSTLTSLVVTADLDTGFPYSLGELTSLKVLHVQSGHRTLHGDTPIAKGEIPKGGGRTLSDALVFGDPLSALSRLTSLTRLQVSFSRCICCKSLSSLLQASNLTFVTVTCQERYLPMGPAAFAIPWGLFKLRNLQYLDLSGNNTVQGPIPQSIGNLSSLSYLDLRGAQLGKVPGEFATIPLQYLYMDAGQYSCPPPPKANACPPYVYKDLPFCATYCKEYCEECPAFNPPPQPPSPPVPISLPRPSPPLPTPPSDPQGLEKGAVISIAVCGALVFLTCVVVSFGIVRTHIQKREVEDGVEKRGTRRFGYKEIVALTRGFETTVGDGSSTLFYGTLISGEEVVVKKGTPEKGKNELEKLNSEVKLLSSLHHKNLVALLGYCRHTSSTFLVYEFMELGSLKGILNNRAQVLSWENRLKVAEGVALGLDYLHSQITPPIVHGAVSSKTILVNARHEGKLSAWSTTSQFVCNVEKGYADPGAETQKGIPSKSDVYSFGVVLLELVTELPAWDEMGHILRRVVGASGPADVMGPCLKAEFRAHERRPVQGDGEIKTEQRESHSSCEDNVKALLALACRCCVLNPLERPDMFHVSGDVGDLRRNPGKEGSLVKNEGIPFPECERPSVLKPLSVSMLFDNVTRGLNSKPSSSKTTG